MRLPVWLVMLVVLTACEKGRTVAVDLRGVTAELAVVLTLDGNEVPVRVSAPFSLSEGSVLAGSPPDWDLEGSEQTMIAVALDDAALSSLYGDLAPRDGQPTIELAPPPDRPSFDPQTSLTEVWLQTAVGPDAFVIPADAPAGQRLDIDEYPTVQAELRVRLPVDPEPCLPRGERRLYPYAAELDGAFDDLGFTRVQQRLSDVARLDNNTALIAGPGLYVLRRGQRAARGRSTHDESDIWIPGILLFPNGRGGRVVSIALLPAGGDGVRRGVITARSSTEDEGDISWIHQITFGPNGVFLEQTLAELAGRQLENVDIDADGRFVTIAEDGQVFVGELGSTTLENYTVTDRPLEGLVVGWTGQQDNPIVVGADLALYLANTDLDMWGPIDVSAFNDSSEISEIALLPERNQIWAAGTNAAIMVREGRGDWEYPSLQLPPRFEPCAIPMSPLEGLRTKLNVDAIAAGDGYIYLSQESCTAVIALREQDRCVSVLTPDGGPAQLVTSGDDDKQLRGATYESGQLIMVGDDGRVLTNLPPP